MNHITTSTDPRRLRCTVVSAVFPPEFTFSAQVSEQLARALAADGHEVTVIAPFPNRPAGQLFPGYKRSLFKSIRTQHGYGLVHCFTTLAPRSHMLQRLLENLSFGLTSSLRLLFSRRQDVAYCNTWAIFAAGMVAVATKLRGVPLVLSIQDLYPESLVVQGRTGQQSSAVRLLRWMDRTVASMAAVVVVPSHYLRDAYVGDRGIPASRAHVVYNWGERGAITFDPQASAAFRKSKQIPGDAFVALYGGNVGAASGADGLVDAFAQLKDVPAYLIIAGSGSLLDACRRRAAELHCERVVFHSPWRHDETSAVLGAADVLLLPTLAQQSLVSMPSKLITYLLAGRPVLAQVLEQSEMAEMIRAAHAGWTIIPERPDLLASAIRRMMSLSPEERQRLGANGKLFAERNLCRESNLPKLLDILMRAAKTDVPGEKPVAATVECPFVSEPRG